MKNIIYIVLIVIGLSGCETKQNNTTKQNLDTLYKPKYAKHFVILENKNKNKNKNKIIIRVKNPWQGAKNITIDYDFEKNIQQKQRIITMSSSHSAFLEAIECGEKIVGVSAPHYLTSTKMQKLPDVGYDAALNFELVVGLDPTLFTCYEVAGGNSNYIQKIKTMGINPVYIADYLENSPLAKAEWVIAFGAMTNKIDEAKKIFQKIEENYTKTKNNIAKFLKNTKNKKKVMLNSPYKDVWYLPGDSSYIVQMIVDAGAEYAAKGVKNNISRAVSIEKAYKYLQNADLWLNTAEGIKTKKQLIKQTPILEKTEMKVYTNNKRTGLKGGSDIWESGTLRCDIILLDMVKIIYPEIPIKHNLYYHKEIK